MEGAGEQTYRARAAGAGGAARAAPATPATPAGSPAGPRPPAAACSADGTRVCCILMGYEKALHYLRSVKLSLFSF